MSLYRTALTLAVSTALVFTFGCSSKSTKKTAATGAPKAATTKQPPSAPKPATKTGTNVAANKSSAVSVEADAECTAAEEGLAACVDTFVVFCASTKMYALDCASAFGATCGTLDDGTIDCVVVTED